MANIEEKAEKIIARKAQDKRFNSRQWFNKEGKSRLIQFSILAIILLLSITPLVFAAETEEECGLWCQFLNWIGINGAEQPTTVVNQIHTSTIATLKQEKLEKPSYRNKAEDSTDCFSVGVQEICFSTNVQDAVFFYQEVEEGIKFGWNATASSREGLGNFVIHSNINFDDLQDMEIDWSDFDKAGLNYSIQQNNVIVYNPEVTNWFFDPIIANIGETFVSNNRNIIEDNSNNLWVAIQNRTPTPYEIYLYKSIDEGNTWTKKSTIALTNSADWMSNLFIDHQNILHLAAVFSDGSGYEDLRYYTYNITSETFLGNFTLVDGTSASTEVKLTRIDIAMNPSNNIIYVVYSQEDGTAAWDLLYRSCDLDTISCYNATTAWTAAAVIADASVMGYNQGYGDIETNGTDMFIVWNGKNATYPTSDQIFYTPNFGTTKELIAPDNTKIFVEPMLIFYNNTPMVATEQSTDDLILFNKRNATTWGSWITIDDGASTTNIQVTLSELNGILHVFWRNADNTSLYCIGNSTSTNGGANWATSTCFTPWQINAVRNPQLSYQFNKTWDLHLTYLNYTGTIYNEIYMRVANYTAPDTTPPNVTLNAPINFFNSTSTTITFNCTAFDNVNLTNVTLYGNWSGGWHANQTNSTPINNTPIIFSKSIPDGIYKWNCQACDASSNCNFSSVNRTFTIDAIPPAISVTYPLNQTYSTNVSALNYTVSDLRLSSCWYSLNNGVTNTSITCGTNKTGLISVEGSNTWKVWANDTFGNVNSSSVTFFKDTIKPQIAITYPLNTTYTINVSALNYTVSDTNLQVCWYSLNLGTTNTTVTCGTNLTGLTSNEGSNTWKVYANDSVGNVNSSSVTFIKDTGIPIISIISPQTTTYNNKTILVNISSDGVYTWYNWNGTNITYTTPIYITFNEGSNTLNAWTNDTANNIGSASVTFTADTIKPLISFVTPTTASGNYSRNWIAANVTATDTNLQTIVVRLYNSTYIQINSSSSSTSPLFINFTSLADGTYYLNATANDTIGNSNSTETRTILLDTIKPLIAITYPLNTTYNINVSSLNYTLSDTNLQACWYSLNLGVTNTSVACGTNLTGLTSNEGSNTWKVYANDTLGNTNSSSVTFTKDTAVPTIDIIKPASYDIYFSKLNIPLNYSVTATNLDKCWYNLDSGSNISLAGCLNITFNVTENKNYALTLWANNTWGGLISKGVNFTVINKTIALNYNINAIESDDQTFSIVLEGDNQTNNNIVATLTYNNSQSSSSLSKSGKNWTLTNTIALPFIGQNYTNKSFYWTFNITYGSNNILANSSAYNQTLYQMLLTNCTYPPTNTTAINFSFVDKITKLPITADFSGLFTTWKNSTRTKTFNFSEEDVNSTDICIYPSWATYTGNIQAEIENVNFAPREYYAANVTISNVTNNITIYFLEAGEATKFLITILDGVDKLEKVIVKINIFDIDTGSYILVETRESDESGIIIAYLELDEEYLFIVEENATVLGSRTLTARCLQAPCLLDVNIAESITDVWQPYYETFAGDMWYTLKFNTTTKIVTYIYTDLLGVAQNATLQVDLIRYNESYYTVCNVNTTGISGGLTCNLTGYDGDFKATAYAGRSPDKIVDYIFISIQEFFKAFANEGLLFTFMIIVTIGLVGIWNPSVGITMVVAGLFFSKYLGFALLTPGLLTLAVILAAIFIIKMRT